MSWLSFCRILALVGMFVAAVIVTFPEEILLVMFGEQWLMAAPALGMLGLSVGVQMVNSSSGAIFQSAGRTDMLFRSGLICTGISVVAILAGVATGSLAWLGLLISLAYLCHFMLTAYLLVWKVLEVSPLAFLVNFIPAVAAAVVSCVAVYGVGEFIGALPEVAQVLIRAIVLAGAYASVALATGEHRALKAFSDMKKIGA